jgi:GWxTD domain-containing protein
MRLFFLLNRNLREYVFVQAFCIIVIAIFLFPQCKSGERISQNRNFASLYNPGASSIHPQFWVYHLNDSVTDIFFRLNPGDLLFNSANQSGELSAKVQFKWVLYFFDKVNQVADSSSLQFNIKAISSQNSFTSYFPIRISEGNQFTLEIETTDVNRKSSHSSFIHVDKRDEFNRQNFLITEFTSQQILFGNKIKSTDTLFVKNSRYGKNRFFVKYYDEPWLMPSLPYSLGNEKEETLKPSLVTEFQVSDTSGICLVKPGMYHIINELNSNQGITLFNFGEFYPTVKTPDKMILPLRYLTTSKEFRKLIESQNPKLALDSFWLQVGGNADRARELIRVFYNRVMYANIYFQSDVEGWMSDRGMLYVVFGPPRTIYKSNDSERWIYGDNKSLYNMDFYFQKTENPFTPNSYVLKRNEIYKTSWFQAIDTWRGGRVYSVEN